MFKTSIGIALLGTVVAISGCATRAETVGAATGVAVGSAMGGGAIGTLGAGMVGYAAGRSYDEHHNR